MNEADTVISHGNEIVKHMVAICKNVAIYPLEHPSVVEPAEEMCALLGDMWNGRPHITINIVNSEIYIENHLLVEESVRHQNFIELLMSRGVNNIVLEPGLTPMALGIFFSLIHKERENTLRDDTLGAELHKHGCAGIHFKTLVGMELRTDVYDMAARESVTAHASYENAVEQLRVFEHDVLANKSISGGALRAVVSSLMGDFLGDDGAASGLVNIKNYEEHLFHHSVNVAVLCLLIASRLSLSEGQIEMVGIAGLLHDIGKLKIPREILNKPGRLTDEEWALIKRHPLDGAEILMRYENLGELPVLAALEHHAGYNMKGYPDLKGTEFPHAISRIVCIADVFEALTADRCYRPTFRNAKEAVDVMIAGSGTKFDPLLVKLLLNIIGAFPVNTTVLLKTGESGVVVESNKDNPFCPRVCLIDDETGEPTSKIIDIAELPAEYAVVGVADTD